MGLGGADSLAFLVLLHAPVIGIVTIPDVVAAAFQQCPRAGRAQWRRRDGRSARIAARGPQFPLSALRPVPVQIRSDSIPCRWIIFLDAPTYLVKIPVRLKKKLARYST